MIEEGKFNLFAQVANASHNCDEFKILMKDLMGEEAYEEYADAYKASQDFYFRWRQVLSGELPEKNFEAMIKAGCFDKFLFEKHRHTIISDDEKTKLVVESDGSCTIKDNNSDFFA